jgi:uncharacterized coiled-coil protein SlyX
MDESLAAGSWLNCPAHLEHQQEELNQVVVEQARLIGRLQKEVARASDAMEGQELERIRANNQKPPHYQ